MTETDQMRMMIEYIAGDVLRGSEPGLDADTELFSSGLMDSMAVVDVLHKLEDVTGLRIPVGRLKLRDVDTVRLMLQAAARVGQPR